jgi:hypothetical protein
MGGGGDSHHPGYTGSRRPHGLEKMGYDRRKFRTQTLNYASFGIRLPMHFAHDGLLDLLSEEAKSG